MKRIVRYILFLMLVLSFQDFAYARTFDIGDSIYFGRYEQDGVTENGLEPIEWIVLDVKDGRMLLISKDVIDFKPYNNGKSNVAWETCTIREWLNGEFYFDNFSDDEREAILLVPVSNDAKEGYGEWDAKPTADTKDRLFLLSYAEVNNYFGSKNARETVGSKYVEDKYKKTKNVAWSLRSPGRKGEETAFIDKDGGIDSQKPTFLNGIRPAVWISSESDIDHFPYYLFQNAISAAPLETHDRLDEILDKYQTSFPYAANLKILDSDSRDYYGEAAETLESLGDYNNSIALAREYRYRQAIRAAEVKDYKTAIELFDKLDGFKDSFQQGCIARYNFAVHAQENGNYEDAADMFSEVGQYKDSMKRLKECYDHIGVSINYLTAETVNCGNESGYAKKKAINKDDQHFGWTLGEFFMSGFTRAIDGTSDNPTFIKTLDDSITLWFDLQQDIDALNGQKNLSISDDKNGLNEYYGIEKTHFGRGTLIVQQTDYQNKKNDPILYTDYLVAKGTTGADTKVIFNEEGDYEVSLDYEIKNSDYPKFLNRSTQYQISVKFSIRNGNCMVYPFDLVTGQELTESAVTENGFYLDLAKSRYLDINVKYSVYTYGSNGVKQDVRFNRPAKDGDKYDSTGIYTISVKNRYTGESTEKTIFVGSEDELDEYEDNGFSLIR